MMSDFRFLYSVILTEYVAIEPRVCVCVCVCVSVCVCHLYSLNGWTDFDETFHKSSDRYLPVTFFAVFEISNLMTSWRPFCIFTLRHSHGRNFGPIFFKFRHKFLQRMPMFAIENQQDRLITSGYRENRVWQKLEILARKLKFSKSGKQSVDFY